ncbi:MAG: hypothetical protein LCH76_08760 [Actinobacteria bacterium]|nr:hypothetical protein [Actinomycetota bacterium]
MFAVITGPQVRRPDESVASPSLLDPAGQLAYRTSGPPPGFDDLQLACALSGAGEFQRAVWYAPPSEPGTVAYRQAVVAELRRPEFRGLARRLTTAVAGARRSIENYRKAHYQWPAEIQLADAIARFTGAIAEAARGLDELRPASAGLRGLAGYLSEQVASAGFQELARNTVLDRIRGCSMELGIHNGTVWVAPDTGRPGWGEQITATFARFYEPGEQPEATWVRPERSLNHVEAQAVELVATSFPELFAELHRFVGSRRNFLPAALQRLAQELRFYLDFLHLMDELSARGVAWCLPRSTPDGAVRVRGMVDLALAVRSDSPPIANDLLLTADERVVFVTGPNQGGKTTFARGFGQLCYLAGLGLPVPAQSASLPWTMPVLTHFPAPDAPDRGGLADELARLHEALTAAGPHALLIFNELFSATSAADALLLSAKVVEQLRMLGCRVIWVTFLEELVLGTEPSVSLVGQVEPEDPTRPTFRFRPQPPGGRSHAVALAARHGLSGADLAERLR